MSSFAQAGAVQAANDEDTLETQEWLEALAAVLTAKDRSARTTCWNA